MRKYIFIIFVFLFTLFNLMGFSAIGSPFYWMIYETNAVTGDVSLNFQLTNLLFDLFYWFTISFMIILTFSKIRNYLNRNLIRGHVSIIQRISLAITSIFLLVVLDFILRFAPDFIVSDDLRWGINWEYGAQLVLLVNVPFFS